MTEMIIDNGIMIDDAESVLFGIRDLSGRNVSDLEVVKRFITREKNTRFYMDSNLNSCMQKQPCSVYAWLDTGYTDRSGEPILISLLKQFDGFCGHMVGTIRTLAESVKRFFGLSYNIVNRKLDSFRKKYYAKADERQIKHILDEQRYLVDSLHQFEARSEFAIKLEALGLVFEEEEETECVVSSEAEPAEKDETEFSEVEEEITIGLLLEKMESMQAYMDELVQELERVSTESCARIDELQKKNDEYKRAILQMREFTGVSDSYESEEKKDSGSVKGHGLLGTHGKILVIGGQELGANVIYGIAKTMGFEKKDFELIDYDKAKSYTERIRKNGKYSAVIFGACPHKTTAGAGYSSAVEKFKQIEGMPFVTDARSKSGRLKVTKESFRNALTDVFENLKMAYA